MRVLGFVIGTPFALVALLLSSLAVVFAGIAAWFAGPAE
jgi:uncharacterized membrane protein